MTTKQYYQFAFLSPILLPFILMAAETGLEVFTGWQPSQLTGFLMISAIFGGIPYLVFLGGFYWWIKGKSGSQIHKFSYIFPLVYLFIFLFWIIAYMLLIEPKNLQQFFGFLVSRDLWSAYYSFGKIALVVSYLYIIAINLGYGILKLVQEKFYLQNK